MWGKKLFKINKSINKIKNGGSSPNTLSLLRNSGSFNHRP